MIVFRMLRAAFRGIRYVVTLVKDGPSDLDGTYPDRRRATGEQAATNASVSMSLTGLGGSM